MSFITTFRLVVFGIVVLFSLAVLGLCAHILSGGDSALSTGVELFSFGLGGDFASVGVAAAVISLVAVVPFFVVGFMRTNAIVNWIAVELSALFILWILWVVCAARTSAWNNALSAGCKEEGIIAGGKAINNQEAQEIQEAQAVQTFCREMQAVEGLSFVAWIFILFYVGTILTNAFLAMTRGNKKIWTTSVIEADFSARPQNDRFPMTSAKTEPSPMYQQPQYQQPQYTGQQGYNGAPAPVVQSMNTGGYNHGNMAGQV